MVFIFHFRFRKSGAIEDAPINRFQSFVDVTFFEESDERIGGGSFIRIAHRQIRIIPLAQHAEALEIAAMSIHISSSKFAAHAAEFLRRYASLFPAQLFFHLGFNRQSVAIPSRHIRRSKTSHGFRFDHEIFQNFIQCLAQMNIPGGIRWPVMQHIERRGRSGIQDPIIKIQAIPLR